MSLTSKGLNLVLTITLAGLSAFAQPNQINLRAETPSPVAPPSAVYTGQLGGSQIHYWVVARYPIGDTQAAGPATANNTVGVPNLTAVNFVVVTWGAVAGATNYDVLRAITPAFPILPCTACAVVLNTALTTVTDNSAAGLAYPPAGRVAAVPALLELSIDNRDENLPFVRFRMNNLNMRLPPLSGAFTGGNLAELDANGRLVDSGLVAPAGALIFGPLATVGSVPFVIAANQLGEDNANFFWDDASDFLGLGTAIPLSDLHLQKAADTEILVESTGNDAFLTLDPAAANSAFMTMRRGVGGEVWQFGMDAADGDRWKLASGAVTDANTVFTARVTQAVGVGPANVDPVGTLNVLNRVAAASTSLWVGSDQTNTSAAETELVVVEGAVQAATVIVSVLDNAMAATYFAVAAGGNVGVRVADPVTALEVFAAAAQLTLSFDADSFVTYSLDAADDLTVTPAASGGVRFESTTDTVDFFQVNDTDGGIPVLNVDTLNERLGVGTAAPGFAIHAVTDSANTEIRVERITAGPSIGFLRADNNRVIFGGLSNDNVVIQTQGLDTITLLPVTQFVGIGPNNATPTGTADFLDRTAATGATEVKIGTDGTNPSALTTELHMWDGSTQAAVPLITLFDNAGANGLGLDRDGAGLLGVSNGVAGTNTGDISFEQWIGTAVLFAALGAPANGTFLYCSDCTIASPCAAAGNGAFAKRLNGVWVCN